MDNKRQVIVEASGWRFKRNWGIYLKRRNTAFLLLLLIFALGITAVIPSMVTPLSIFSYNNKVPIQQLGHDEVEDYWILSTTVNEVQTFTLVLDGETTENMDDNTQVKVKSEVGIELTPLLPSSTTNLAPANIMYRVQGLTGQWAQAPAYNINGAGWLTTTSYRIRIIKNGNALISETVKVNYQQPQIVTLPTGEGDVTVNNLGMIPQGVEVPSGSLVVAYDPSGNKHVYEQAAFINMVNHVNDFIGPTSIVTYDWNKFWGLAVQYGWVPQDVLLTHVNTVDIPQDKSQITLIYSGLTFVGLITLYIPDDLADTIIVQLNAPNPKITIVDPAPLPEIGEGEKTSFQVTVYNFGSDGTISISCLTTDYAVVPLTQTTINMANAGTFIFKFEATALSTLTNKTSQITIYVQGRGGSDTYNLQGRIKDVPDHDPEVPPETETTLIVFVKDGGYKSIPEITVSIIYGASTDTQMSNVDGATQFELGLYTGPVKIITQETSMYQSKTEIVTVKMGANEHTMILGGVDWTLLIAALIIATVAALGFFVFMKKRRSL